MLKPRFYIPTFCSFCDFTHFLFIPDQSSIIIMFLEFYSFPDIMPF